MFLLHEPPPEPREYTVTSLAYAPGGDRLAAGIGLIAAGRSGSRGRVLEWTLPFGTPPEEVHTCRNFARAVGFSPCGEWFAYASGNRHVHCVHRSTGRSAVRTGHTRPAVAITFGPGPFLLTGSADKYSNTGGGEALVSHVDEIDLAQTVGQAFGSGTTAVAWAPGDDNHVAIAQRGRVELRKLWTRSLRKLVTTTQPDSLSFSPDGRLLAAAMGWTVRTWRLDVDGRPEVRDLKGHNKRVNAVAFHPHESILATTSADGTVRLWDCSNLGSGTDNAEIARYDWGLGSVRCVAFHPDGSTAAVGGSGIVVFDVA